MSILYVTLSNQTAKEIILAGFESSERGLQRECCKVSAEVVLEKQECLHKDFSGGPVSNTLYSRCREHRFNPWLGN